MTASFVREALLQQREGERVRCLTCERRCLLSEGQVGWCRTRENRKGTLVTLTYGNASSIALNPIEKKPLFHFYPGSLTLTVGSWSCNFACPWCQNWEISKQISVGEFVSPHDFVALMERYRCQGSSISFNEPTLSLEWSLEVFRQAKERGFYNTFVTNGYMTLEALRLLIDAGLDAVNVDIKGSPEAVRKYCGVDVEKVWRNCQFAKENGVHVEVTTLVIPTVNDDETSLRAIARRIAMELDKDTPWHVTAYYPAYLFNAPPTPVSTLERAYQIGREEGLRFVYLGNVPGHPYENTYCPSCSALLIQRFGVRMAKNRMKGNKCPQCGEQIPIIGADWQREWRGGMTS